MDKNIQKSSRYLIDRDFSRVNEKSSVIFDLLITEI